VNISTDVQFYCNVTAKPTARIEWYKHDLHRKKIPVVYHTTTTVGPVHTGRLRPSDCSTAIQNCSDNDLNHLCTTCGKLSISNTQATDSTCYECDATNDCDKTVDITCLTVQGKH